VVFFLHCDEVKEENENLGSLDITLSIKEDSSEAKLEDGEI
jgi:hypothetical protein